MIDFWSFGRLTSDSIIACAFQSADTTAPRTVGNDRSHRRVMKQVCCDMAGLGNSTILRLGQGRSTELLPVETPESCPFAENRLRQQKPGGRGSTSNRIGLAAHGSAIRAVTARCQGHAGECPTRDLTAGPPPQNSASSRQGQCRPRREQLGQTHY